MAKLQGLIISGILLLAGQVYLSNAQANNCDRVEPCFTLNEFPCNEHGMRQVCLVRADLAGCTINDADDGEFCNAFMIGQTGALEEADDGEQVCQTVKGGSNAQFGVDDGDTLGSGPNPRTIMLSGRSVACSGYTNACAVGGNNDILLSFTSTACPTTTTPTTTPTTTTKKDCTCVGYEDVGSCTATCGSGVQHQKKVCVGSACHASDFTTRTIPCPGLSPCTGTWSAFTNPTCPVSCGGGTITRTRTCVGGTACPGSPTTTAPCNTQGCPTPPPPTPPPTTRRSGRGGRRRGGRRGGRRRGGRRRRGGKRRGGRKGRRGQ